MLRCLLAITLFAAPALSQGSPLKAAQAAFERAAKLEKHYPEQALAELDRAVALAPENSRYAAARELVRERLTGQRLQQASDDLAAGREIEAAAEFRAADALDPVFGAARDRPSGSRSSSLTAQLIGESQEIGLQPAAGRRDLHFRGDTRSLLDAVARSFGLTAVFDENFSARAISFDLSYADFSTMISLASSMAKAMWTPVSSSTIFFAQDTPANHQQFDRFILRTFYFPDLSTPQQMNDLVSTLRGIFELRYVIANPAQSLISVRAPRPVMDAVTVFLETLDAGRPQVMLDIQAFEVNRDRTRDLGVQLPLQFQLINLTSAALAAAAAQPGIQQQINQIIANGGLTPANQAAIAALLAELQNLQNSQIQQLIHQPFATFGGGLTRFAVIIPPVSGKVQFNQSAVTSLEHVSLRAAQGDTATMRIGTRFPVLTSIFSAATNNLLSSFLGNTASTAASNPLLVTPSFSYEDLGITVKAKPQVNAQPLSARDAGDRSDRSASADVSLDLELAIRSLAGSSFNGVPVIANREYKGSVRLKDGEPAVIAGSITRSELRSLTGLPGLGRLPLLNHILSSNSSDRSEDEILILITPHILRRPTGENLEQWLPPLT